MDIDSSRKCVFILLDYVLMQFYSLHNPHIRRYCTLIYYIKWRSGEVKFGTVIYCLL